MGNLALLSPKRLTAVTQAIMDPRLRTQRMIWLERTPLVEATEDEMFGRWADRIQIADIINDDAEALTYSAGRMEFRSYSVPKIKHGTSLTEGQVRELRKALRSGRAEGTPWANLERRIIRNQVLGVRQRMEAICIGGVLGEFHYDRLGMKIDITFPIPADLKMVADPPWTDHANAHPVQDCWDLKLQADQRYGNEVSRLSMSTPAFLHMIQCTEFQTKARMYLAPNVSFVNLNDRDLGNMKTLAQTVLGFTVEFDDRRYWNQHAGGKRTSHRFWPANKVSLTNPAFDGDASVRDFASGELIEPLVLDILDGGGSLDDEPIYGPYSYVDGDRGVNPATLDFWTAFRGFVRPKIDEDRAIIDIGAVYDTIPIYDTYPMAP
jgi:hypothetical protein